MGNPAENPLTPETTAEERIQHLRELSERLDTQIRRARRCLKRTRTRRRDRQDAPPEARA